MTDVIAIFDIGKTNKKILLFDKDFKVVYQHEQKMPVISDEDDFECDDINLITSWIKEELKTLVEGNTYNLIAVNFSTYGASLMFLDSDGLPLTPVYNYLKPVPEKIAADLFNQYGGKDEFCRKTASPSLGLLLNSGIQILWLKNKKNEVWNKVKDTLHFPQYLSFSLTGKIASEPTSIGCHTFMWDYDNMKYHNWIADNSINLPDPINNDVVFDASIEGKTVKIGTGIHDSSASLVPYLKASKEKFILVSTGTWCINMNPFNSEALTASQLEQDCLCFMTPEKKQVKSSRLFMGHFHEVWAEKLSTFFGTDFGAFKTIKMNTGLLDSLENKFDKKSVFFPNGKDQFEEDMKNVDLSLFGSYEEAYTKLMIDLTSLCITSINLVIPKNDESKILYVSGGFARNEIFLNLLTKHFKDKEIKTSDIDNSSALGAALVISQVFGNKLPEINL